MTQTRAHTTTKAHAPHKQVSRHYQKGSKHTNTNPRQVEAQALLKAARFMHDIQSRFESITHAELEAALKINRHIWMAFFEKASESEEQAALSLPANITTLATFVFKRSFDILTKPKSEKLSALITINREVAAGLMTTSA
jgi:flagellar protein FlaF